MTPLAPAAKRLDTVPLWVFGATGMLGGELLRLLEAHPGFAPAAVSRKGAPLAETQPHVAAGVKTMTPPEAEEGLAEALERGPAAVALSLPHGESADLYRG